MEFLHRRARTAEAAPTLVGVFMDRLGTANAGLAFDVRIHIEWRRDLCAPSALATPRMIARTVREIVAATVKETSVLRTQDAEEKTDAILRSILPVQGEGFEVLRASVTLKADEETINAAKQIERLLHEQELDKLARRQVKARADFLREVIFADPASAYVYTLLDVPQRAGGPVKDVNIDEMVRRVNEWNPESRWVIMAQVLTDFVSSLTESGRKDLLKVFSTAINTLGTAEQSEALSRAMRLPEDH
ncbi:hypothetical protein [Nonomuraea sp. NPDC052265]|uniref:hypothetical protein n=1 Tax=Nonomuraea sp. NPDC052265 TaxID=3364374 RepID=UPI0037C77D02